MIVWNYVNFLYSENELNAADSKPKNIKDISGYSEMTDNKAIKEFVRKTLGCNCPEEVFQYIDCRTFSGIGGNILPAYEINIGNRLLIFAAEIDEVDSLRHVLSKLVQAGVNKRNEQKFNRFRLVLLSDRDVDINQHASEIFNSLPTDEKVHLHVINKDDFPVNLKN